MRYTRLGNTGLLVSQVGIGGAVVGGAYPDPTTRGGNIEL